MFKKTAILLLSIILLFCISCRDFKEVTVSKIENLKILKFSSQGIEVGLGMTIKNTNSISFTVYPSSFDVKLNDVFIGTATIKDKVHVPANSEQQRTFIFTSDLSRLNFLALPKLLAMIQDKEANASVEGQLRVGNFFYKRDVPLSLNQKISLSQ